LLARSMASEAGTTTAPKHEGMHQDVEVGSDVVDVDRIEEVYA